MPLRISHVFGKASIASLKDLESFVHSYTSGVYADDREIDLIEIVDEEGVQLRHVSVENIEDLDGRVRTVMVLRKGPLRD